MDKNNSKHKKKILIIRFGAIGDVVHSSIIWSAIKSAHPECEIHFMTSSYIKPIIKRDTNLEKVISFDMKHRDNLIYLLWHGLKLRLKNYDYVINLQNSFRNQFLAFMSGGVYVARSKNNVVHATDAFYYSALNVFDDLKKPENLKLYLENEKLEQIKSEFAQYPRPYIFINPAGDHDKFRKGRIWKFEYWNELGEKLHERFGGTIFVTGSKSESEMHLKNIKIKNAVILSGKYSLDKSIHAFSLADLFISGDSGPLHMASALDVKTLGLYGSTSSVYCAPYGSKGNIIKTTCGCRGCNGKNCTYIRDNEKYTPCMNEIKPQNVYEFILNNNLL